MNYSLTRDSLQKNATRKLADSQVLFANGCFSNAFYLAGYSIEIGIKACIAKHFIANVIPDKRLVNDAYSHDFEKLVGVAGLRSDLDKMKQSDSLFQANWGIVSQWTPDIRYDQVDKSTTNYFIYAITEPDHGVFKWIAQHW